MNTNENALRGTPAQLAGRLAVNGKPLGQAEISFLTRMGFAQSEGTAKTRSGRGGKPATIWSFNAENAFTIEPIEKARGRRKATKAVSAPVVEQPAESVTKADLSNLAEMIVRGVAEAVSGKPAASAEEPASGRNKKKAA